METAPDVLDGRYELGPVLGRGGMGEVRAATDRRLGRRVAVKLLHPQMAVDASARRRFEDEALAAAQLVHPNVVGVFDAGEQDGTAYIVMEYLPGRTLADEIADGPLPTDRVRAVAIQVLGALDAAHGAGVIHRDIKPGNILLTADGSAKVADFGIAKTAEGIDHTITGMVIGTPTYLAPERVAGLPATAQSDLYAVGIVLYEALTGIRPFADRTPMAAAAAVQHEQPASLAAARPDADPALVAAVERAMAKAVPDRFQTAAEMAAAIAGERSTRAAAEPETTISPAAAPLTREVRAMATTTMPVAEPAAAPPATAPPVAAPGPAARPPLAPPRRPTRMSRTALAALVGAALLLVVLLAALIASEGDTTGPGGPGSPTGVEPAPAGDETAPPTGPQLPARLEERMRDLEEAVQP